MDSDPQLPSCSKDHFGEMLIDGKCTSTPATYKRKRSTRKGSGAVKLATRKRRSSTGGNARSGDISVVSANSADVSERQPVETVTSANSADVSERQPVETVTSANSADVSERQPVETVTSTTGDKEKIVPSEVFKGVVVFVDYNSAYIKLRLKACGATVAKTFNKKVQYVIFGNGHRTTYNLAIKRKIPLVGIQWVQECCESNKLVNPDDYPAADLEEYANYEKNALLFKLKNKRTRKDIIDSDKLEFIELKKCVMNKRNNALENVFQEVLDGWGELEGPIQYLDEEIPPQQFATIDSIKEQLIKILNAEDYCDMSVEEINKMPIPEVIGRLSQFLTPKGIKKTTLDIRVDLSLIEDYLGLNDQCKGLLNKLVFSPRNKKLHIKTPFKMVKKKKIQPHYDNDCTSSRNRPLRRITKESNKSISSVGMTKGEVSVIKRHIQDLGTFSYCPKVKSTTKYIIMKSMNYKPLYVMFAPVRGCHIVSDKWVHESHTVGHWLPHESYLISN